MQAIHVRIRMRFSIIVFITAVFLFFSLFIISTYSKDLSDQGNDWHSPLWWYPLGHEGLQSNPRGIAIIPLTNQAVATNEKSNTVAIIDLHTQKVLSEVHVGKGPKGIALDSELYIALVANSHDDTVSFIDLERFNVISTLRVGKSPAGVAIDQTTHTAVITSLHDDSISFVDLKTREIVATTKTGEKPIDVAVIGATESINNGGAIDPARYSGRGIALVVNNESHNISVIDVATHMIIESIDVNKKPLAIDVNPKTHLAVVTHEKDNSITVIDTQTWHKRMIRIGKYPVDIAVNAFTNQAVVVCNEEQTLVQVDLGTNEIIQTYPLKKHPQAVAVNRFTNAAAVIEDRLGGLTLIQLQSTDNLPKVAITSPTNNATVNASPIKVSGTVKNAVRVVVNDVTATITGESFSAMVNLNKKGSITLTAVATDQTGRMGYHSITVIYTPVIRGTIAGTVVNAITGGPILGATVSITDAQGVIKTTATSANGGFSITAVAVGDFIGSVVKTGYSTFGFAGTAIVGQTNMINAPLVPIPPVVSGITVTEITADSARISWTTDQSADSLVEYGETVAYGGSKVDTALTTSHSLILTGLASSRTYHVRVTSISVNGASGISGDNTFKTQNRIDITITTPADGATITVGQGVMVAGTVSNSANEETGVTVNGIVSTPMGSQFAVSHVPLNPGANTITVTATGVDGTTATKSVTVTAFTANHDIKLTAYPESGTAPLEVTLRINGSFSIANPSITTQGPSPVEQLPSANPAEYKYKINTEGVYYFTAQATGPDNNTYQDTIVITVLPLTQIDNLLRAKWSAFTGALQQKNTTAALNLMLPDSRGKYQIMFDILKDQLPSIVATYVTLGLDSIQGERAWYELTATQNGSLFSYRVGFMKDAKGLWLLREF
jgi:YVTN family beta-propeller protein